MTPALEKIFQKYVNAIVEYAKEHYYDYYYGWEEFAEITDEFWQKHDNELKDAFTEDYDIWFEDTLTSEQDRLIEAKAIVKWDGDKIIFNVKEDDCEHTISYVKDGNCYKIYEYDPVYVLAGFIARKYNCLSLGVEELKDWTKIDLIDLRLKYKN